PFPQADSLSLAAHLLGRMTSASQAAIRAEHRVIVQEALNSMDPIDREVLALRHIEHLSNDETAQVLGLTKSAASNRYIRALRRLKDTISSIPGPEGATLVGASQCPHPATRGTRSRRWPRSSSTASGGASSRRSANTWNATPSWPMRSAISPGARD